MNYCDIMKLRDEAIADLNAVGLTVPVKGDEIEWQTNVKMRPWGQCRPPNAWRRHFTIRLSQQLCQHTSPKIVRDTICHELIHVIYPRAKHGWLFKDAAEKMNSHYAGKYDISRILPASTAMTIEEAVKAYKFVVKCPKCGKFWGHHRVCGAVRTPFLYRCPDCKSGLELVHGRAALEGWDKIL